MANQIGDLSEEYVKEVTWKIPNFMDMPRTEDYNVTSPEFRLADATWRLRLYPRVWFCNTFDWIHMYLERVQSFVPVHRVLHETVLKTRNPQLYYGCMEEHTFVKNSESSGLFRLIWPKMIGQKELLSPDGTLTMFCQIWVIKRYHCRTREFFRCNFSHAVILKSLNHREVGEASTSVQKLQLDYSKLLKDEEDSDVCLKVSDKEFRAHRCILRARSKVFSAMFKHETEEKASGEVVIDDLDPDSFPDFLQHVYTGRVESLTSKNVFSLYRAADKYDLQELKSECREYMKRILWGDTFCDVMTLALMHQEEELLQIAKEYFSDNPTRVTSEDKWQTFLENHNTEANELLAKARVRGENN